ncbi:MAG: hypothetical protein V3S68_00220, partial [Dehalococcoidia bacterium]
MEAIPPVLLIVWPWMALPAAGFLLNNLSGDRLTLYLAALVRWRSHIAGKSLAILTLAYVFVLLLNSLSLSSAMDHERVDDPAILLQLKNPIVLRWPRKGRLLRTSDFESPDLRFYVSQQDAEFDDLVAGHQSKLGTVSEAAFGDIERRLLEDLKETPQQFVEAVEGNPSARIWLLEVIKMERFGAASTMYLVEPFHQTVDPIEPATLQGKLAVYAAQRIAAFVLAALAFVFLWERGGDSKSARWAGLWLVGAAVTCLLEVAGLVSTASTSGLAIVSLGSSSVAGDMLPTYWAAIRWVPVLIAVLFATGILHWIMYFHLQIQPGLLHGNARPSRFQRARWCLGPPVLVLAMGVVLANILPERTPFGAMVVVSTLGVAAVHLVRRTRIMSRMVLDSEPEQSWPMIGVYFLTSALVAMALFQGDTFSWSSTSWAYIGGAILIALFGGHFVLRSGLFAISGVRNFAYLGSALILPVLFEFAEGVTAETTSRIGIFTEQGGRLAGILIVVLMVQPLSRLLEGLFRRIASPVLARTRKKADELLEASISARSQEELQTLTSELFEDLRLERYTLYSRTGAGQLEPVANRLGYQVPPLDFSDRLCKLLVRNRQGIVLGRVHMAWKFFFDQFELRRIQGDLGSGHLLPLCLGRSLRGILFVPEAEIAGKAGDMGLAQLVNDLGV